MTSGPVWSSQHIGPQRTRLTYALLLSLLIHLWLMSLTFGGHGLWLPGLGFPWQERRTEAPDLRVVLVPSQSTATEPVAPPIAEPSPQTNVEKPDVGTSAPPPSASRAQTSGSFAAALAQNAKPDNEAEPETVAKPKKEPKPKTKTRAKTGIKPKVAVNPKTDATYAAPAKVPSDAGGRTGDAESPPKDAPDVIAVERTDEDTWTVPKTPATPPPVIESTPTPPSTQTVTPSLEASDAAPAHVDQEAAEAAVKSSKQEEQRQAEELEAARQSAAREEAARNEAARVEAAKIEAQRIEAARVEAARVEAARVEAARLEAARVEAANIEAQRIEAARLEAARVEAARVEAARLEAARAEAARVEAANIEAQRVEAARAESARAEAARVEAARLEAARAEAARAEAARVEAARNEAREAEARREERLRAIGRQLDEEAARREAAAAPDRVSPSWGPMRRYRLFGRTDPNEEIIQYAEAWSQKIRMNVAIDVVREVARQPHTDPLVWVAIRSDGSVESVKFVQSSGVAGVDDAIRRIVDSTKPYQAFPPALARQYDVIEIRRTWHFDVGIQLY